MQFAKTKFTLIELLISITIIAILFAILLPSLFRAKEKASRVICISNQRQVMASLINYCGDNDGITPPGPPVLTTLGHWITYNPKDDFPLQLGYIPYYGYVDKGDLEVFYCPSWTHDAIQYGSMLPDQSIGGWPRPGEKGAKRLWYFSYAYRTQYKEKRPLHLMQDSGDLAVITDHWTKKRRHVYNIPLGAGYFSHNQGEGYGTTFLDGHSTFIEDANKDIMHKAVPHTYHNDIKKAWIKYFDGK